MSKLTELGAELELARARAKARVGKVPAPEALLSNLHNIPFTIGQRVIDTVTGMEVEIAGTSVVQYESEDTGA